jgi:hypothetical protein
MVETNPLDKEFDPYYQTVDSDEEDPALAQLWTVSQEEETRGKETDPRLNAMTRILLGRQPIGHKNSHRTTASMVPVKSSVATTASMAPVKSSLHSAHTGTPLETKNRPWNDCLNGTSKVFCSKDYLNGTSKVIFGFSKIGLNGKNESKDKQ